jgi:hypothetical protein
MSSTRYSSVASQVPEQPMFWLRFPVNSTVPGSTECQQLRSKGTMPGKDLAGRLGKSDPVQTIVDKPDDLTAGRDGPIKVGA